MTSNAKVALVTGASRGLGRNMAIALARKGVDVIRAIAATKPRRTGLGGHRGAGPPGGDVPARYRQNCRLRAVRSELKRALADGWSRRTFDYLVNNAGIGIQRPSPRRPKPSSTR